jgi:homoserine kinase
MALKLYNIIELEKQDAGISIEVIGEGVKEIARDERNIVYQAVWRLFKQINYPLKGLKIKLINHIPVTRGLGSSAAAIVGGLIGANMLSGGKLSLKDILNLAANMEGHPDNVAPAIYGGILVSVPVDNEIKSLKILPPAGLKVIVGIPDYPLATKKSREVLPQQVSLQDAVFNLGRLALLVAALHQGDLSLLATAMEDRLHQPYRAPLIPGMKKIFAAARLAGARGVTLSGAGPTIAAFVDRNPEHIAQVMRDTFKENGLSAKTVILETSLTGARALEVKS